MTPVGIDISKELLEGIVAKAVPGVARSKEAVAELMAGLQMMRSSRLRPPAATTV